MHTKREKDLRQAAQAFSILIEERPGDVRMVWEEIQLRGKGWVRRVKEGGSALSKIDSAVWNRVAAFLSATR